MWDPLRRRAVSVTGFSMRQLGPLDLVLCPSRGVPVTDDMRCEGVEVVVSATTQVADLRPSTTIIHIFANEVCGAICRYGARFEMSVASDSMLFVSNVRSSS